MKKLTKGFIALIAVAIVGSFVALVVAHILALTHEEYLKSFAYQETIFIELLTLGLAIVLVIPYIISKEQIKKEIENYWKNDFQEKMAQFIGKSEINYAHTSRMMAYLLKQEEHYYWAMAWAGDSVAAYVRRFKEHHDDFGLNKEYFNFSLKMMKISFEKRKAGSFLEKNIDDLEIDDKSQNKSIFEKSNIDPKEINGKIYEGKPITQKENEKEAVKELKRVILRYIKWQCIIYIEMKEDLSNDVIKIIKNHLDPIFDNDFKDMVKNALKSFYYIDEKNADNLDKDQFIDDIVKKVNENDIAKNIELKKEKEKVRKYLEKMLKSN